MFSTQVPIQIQSERFTTYVKDWLSINFKNYQSLYEEHGAVLFRGFADHSLRDFYAFVNTLSSTLMSYNYQSTPRTALGKGIYTATEYPASRCIPLHNENAYTNHWPTSLAFFCIIPATQGGQTPIANSHKIYQTIHGEIRTEFEEKKCRYIRYFYPGIDLSWQTVFQTENRKIVEAYCITNSIEYKWLCDPKGPELMTAQTCESVMIHPSKKIPCWFNQAHLFHPASLNPTDYKMLTQNINADMLPRNVTFGDGSAIPTSMIKEILKIYDNESIIFDWQQGDVLVIDNILFAHGRMAFDGPRKVVVAMF